jgi:hypothetical protein
MSSKAALPPEAQSHYLRGLIDRITAARGSSQRSPVVVFDLDGTLMDNRPRSVAILRELSARWLEHHPEAAQAIAGARPDELAYAITDSLTKLGVDHPELTAEALQFWRDRFFRDAYLIHDVALLGAAAFANAVHEAGANLVYLTGRDLPLMGLGSWMSLRDLGFPIGVVGTELVCKPEASMHDEEFKRGVAPQLARLGEVVASFDNEPGNCNMFLHACPGCASVLLDTQHQAGAPPAEEGVVCIKDFRI